MADEGKKGSDGKKPVLPVPDRNIRDVVRKGDPKRDLKK